MGKFMNALSTAGKAIEAYADYNQEVRTLTNELMRRTYGLDLDQAEKVARTLINEANEVTWK